MNIHQKLIDGRGNVSFTTGTVWLTDEELSTIESAEWTDVRPLTGEHHWLQHYIKDRDLSTVTWADLAKVIRDRNNKESAEISKSIRQAISEHNVAVNDADTKLHNALAALGQKWNKEPVRNAIKKAGVRRDIPELN